jgi:hypothetical protein
VPPPPRRVLAGFLQAFLSVLPQGFRRSVPGHALVMPDDHDGLVGQRGQQPQHLVSGQPVIGKPANHEDYEVLLEY